MVVHDRVGIAAELRGARELAGYSQTELAERIGVERVTLLRWELDQASPTLCLLVAWANSLGYELRLEPTSRGEA